MNEGEYEIRRSARAKYLRITVHPGKRVVVTRPEGVSVKKVEEFVEQKKAWIERVLAKSGSPRITLPHYRKNTLAHKEAVRAARVLIQERLQYFNKHTSFTYGTIAIRNQKTRWGSCSAKNNLNFNYRIIFLPAHLADYILVHELCHTKEHNHGERFWKEVEKHISNHQEVRRELRTQYSL